MVLAIAIREPVAALAEAFRLSRIALILAGRPRFVVADFETGSIGTTKAGTQDREARDAGLAILEVFADLHSTRRAFRRLSHRH